MSFRFEENNTLPITGRALLSILFRLICKGSLDAVQEECVLLDVILFQIRLELFEQICRDLECHGSLVVSHIGSSSFFVFVELSDQPGHVLAEGLAGSFLIFTNLCNCKASIYKFSVESYSRNLTKKMR